VNLFHRKSTRASETPSTSLVSQTIQIQNDSCRIVKNIGFDILTCDISELNNSRGSRENKTCAGRVVRLNFFFAPRYFYFAGSSNEETIEDTRFDEPDADALALKKPEHRHYDERMEAIAAGSKYFSAKCIPSARRRQATRLGVTRSPCIEPIGASRESFYECRLMLGLPWFCEESPQVVPGEDGKNHTVWTFVWQPPSPEELDGLRLEHEILTLSTNIGISFEERCCALDRKFCGGELGIVCPCCLEQISGPCGACKYAVGFHKCLNPERDWGDYYKWRKGTLHGGELDIQRVLFNLHRKLLPTDVIRQKAAEYVESKYISEEVATRTIQVIEQERGTMRLAGAASSTDGSASAHSSNLSPKMTPEQMAAELTKREHLMRQGGGDHEPDQWRVYKYIVHCLQHGEPLRLMVQALASEHPVRAANL
jgi:hypothetical protein